MHASTHSPAESDNASHGLGKSLWQLLNRRIWLPKSIYTILPFLYVALGIYALSGALFLTHWSWIVPYFAIAGIVLFHAGLLVATLRWKASSRPDRKRPPPANKAHSARLNILCDNANPMNHAAKRWAIYALISIAAVPALVFLGGWLLAGPYEGSGGVFGLMTEIYGAALRADPAAWVLLLAPLLLVAIWRSCGWLAARAGQTKTA